ncbi:MAG TPA: acid phosphatase, partial [Polyangia bacterium]|nr:acid phosphatase [Polyangia bacterium]
QYVLADNFYMGAFGGSFLNHQYLICGCAPEYPNANTAPNAPLVTILNTDANGNFLASMPLNTTTTKPSAIDSAPHFTASGHVTPLNYFGDNTYRAVNTIQPPYQPSATAPAAADTTLLYADLTNAASVTLPPQTETTIGDTLDTASVAWKFYGGAWTLATTTTTTAGHPLPASGTGIAPSFQYHHYPFNYYAKFDPVNAAAYRAAHLQDYTDMVSDAAAGTLPAVSFYKPEGDLNQHSGYASIAAGDASLGDLVTKLQASPQWKNMVIVITYDENGGIWDHVAPPKGDLLGPGTRIPAVIISPYAKMGTIDHTQYDTGSIARFITRRFGLTPLAGITARDQALVKNGGTAMGDLTAALDLTK